MNEWSEIYIWYCAIAKGMIIIPIIISIGIVLVWFSFIEYPQASWVWMGGPVGLSLMLLGLALFLSIDWKEYKNELKELKAGN